MLTLRYVMFLCNCAQCDYGLFGGGLIVIVNHVFTLFYLIAAALAGSVSTLDCH